MDVVFSPSMLKQMIWAKPLYGRQEVEMAGFNVIVEHGSIARRVELSQSKKLMRGIKGIYFGKVQ